MRYIIPNTNRLANPVIRVATDPYLVLPERPRFDTHSEPLQRGCCQTHAYVLLTIRGERDIGGITASRSVHLASSPVCEVNAPRVRL